MFYFLLPTLIRYNFILVIAAIIPAVFLMIQTYKLDKLDKESPLQLWSLVKAGIFSALIAMVLERVFCYVLDQSLSQDDALYGVLLYFVIVAYSEEGAKYFMLRRYSWRSLEFNCQYDGVVYAVFVSLGFALWENISYVLMYGFGAAIVRALTAIPGHACFGVFMGVFYGISKKYAYRNNKAASTLFSILSVFIPALLHGTYDYIATYETGTWYFVIFIAALFIISFILIRSMSKRDRYIR